MTDSIRRAMWHLVLLAMLPAAMARAQGDARDWPMYNHDLAGSRYNPAETAIGPANAGQLVEKWRFPARGSEPADRGHPRHADGGGRLRLLRHGHRPGLLQAGARRQALLGLSQADARGRPPGRVGGARGAGARLPLPVVAPRGS